MSNKILLGQNRAQLHIEIKIIQKQWHCKKYFEIQICLRVHRILKTTKYILLSFFNKRQIQGSNLDKKSSFSIFLQKAE